MKILLFHGSRLGELLVDPDGVIVSPSGTPAGGQLCLSLPLAFAAAVAAIAVQETHPLHPMTSNRLEVKPQRLS